jgi:DNA-binding NarL/FixJ family response regulator
MGTGLECLCLEDDPDDVELMQAALAEAGVECRLARVETRAEFLAALENDAYGLILADYSLPGFDGQSALRLSCERRPEVPFILVSGTLGEEVAIEALLEGARDYVLKHRLSRLCPAVRRALGEARERVGRQRVEREAARLLDENRRLSQRLMEVQEEEERRHLAHELHDEIGQSLTAIQAEAQMLALRGVAGDPEAGACAERILGIAHGVYDAVQRILRRLRPAALDHLGLAEALREAVDGWQARAVGVRCRFEGVPDAALPDLGEPGNITLYRAVQECLTNVSHHAQARRVVVTLEPARDVSGGRPGVRLQVSDDGCGFGPDGRHRGLGLVGMRERDITVVAEAGDGQEAYRMFVEHQPDVVVIDLTIPGLTGFEASRRILARDPAARIVVFSVHESETHVRRALSLGILGYLSKGVASRMIAQAVREAAAGRRFVPEEMGSKVENGSGGDRVRPMDALSAREFEVFCRLAEGRTVLEVAATLNISPKTAGNHYTRVKKKLGVSSASELTLIAVWAGLIDP